MFPLPGLHLVIFFSSFAYYSVSSVTFSSLKLLTLKFFSDLSFANSTGCVTGSLLTFATAYDIKDHSFVTFSCLHLTFQDVVYPCFLYFWLFLLKFTGFLPPRTATLIFMTANYPQSFTVLLSLPKSNPNYALDFFSFCILMTLMHIYWIKLALFHLPVSFILSYQIFLV